MNPLPAADSSAGINFPVGSFRGIIAFKSSRHLPTTLIDFHFGFLTSSDVILFLEVSFAFSIVVSLLIDQV